MKKKKILLLILLIFLFSLFILTRFNFDFGSKKTQELKLSEIIKFVKSIKIKYNGMEFIDYDIDKNIAYIDSFLIISNRSQGKIWVVDDSGNVVKIFGGIGSGPGEFKVIQAFDVSKDGLIYVYDYENGRFTCYDLKGNLVKIFSFFEPGLIVNHIAIDDSGNIFVHHPPSERYGYSGFVSMIGKDGKFKKTYTDDIDWGYKGFYYRGFLGGDLIVSNNFVIEANNFNWVSLRYIDSEKIVKFDKPKGLWKEIPKVKSYSLDTLRKAYDPNSSLWGLIRYSDLIMVWYFLPSSNNYGYLLLYNLDGRYLGKVTIDLPLIMHRGNLNYLISIQPNFENSLLNEKIPFIFNVYEFDSTKLNMIKSEGNF